MKKIREYYICDRCKEELLEEPIIEYDNQYIYELCDDCDEVFKEYKRKVNGLEKKYECIMQVYKFGKFLPKNELEKGE